MRLICISLFALALAVPSARAQYVWSVKHSDRIGSIFYTMTAIDCYGPTCTAAAQKQDVSNNDRLTLVFFRSDDNGKTWREQDAGLAPIKNSIDRLWAIQQIDSLNAIAVGGYTTDGQFILRTTDAGNTWQRQYTDTPAYYGTSVNFSDSAHGIMTHSGWDQVSITSDAGAHWNDINSSIPIPLFQCAARSADSFIVFDPLSQKLYTTTNSWENIDSSSTIGPTSTDSVGYVYEYCNLTDGDTLAVYGHSYYNDSSGHSINNGLIVFSSDNGNSWTKSSSTQPTIVMAMTSLRRDTVFAAGESDGIILLSTDHGASWSSDTMILDTSNFIPYYCNGLATTGDGHVVGLFVNGGLAGGQAAIFRREEMVAKVGLPEQRNSFSQIYPNPVLSVLHVDPKLGALYILDPLGRIYTVPRNGNTLDVASLPAGMYSVVSGSQTAKFVKE